MVRRYRFLVSMESTNKSKRFQYPRHCPGRTSPRHPLTWVKRHVDSLISSSNAVTGATWNNQPTNKQFVPAIENANAATVNAKHKREPALSKRNDSRVNEQSACGATYISSGNLHRDVMPTILWKNFKFTVNFFGPSGKRMFDPAKHFAR